MRLFPFRGAISIVATIACLGRAQTPQQHPTPPTDNTRPSPATTGSSSGSPAAAAAGTGASSSGHEEHASGQPTRLGPLAPAPPPAKVFSRPRIGLALGGGAALALSEVGVLQWFEENHIPVDVIAGTSMGCMVSALYSTGRSPAQLKTVMNDKVFSSVFSFSNAYTARSYRRRQDARELPNGITIGLKHRVSFRNSLLTDQGLNAFLQREFFRYDDQTDFNSLPIPLRCISTDLTDAEPVTFARGSIPDAVRASVSIPGVFQPFQMNGHDFVDGGILENLPTPTVHAMQADVVLAVSLPLQPVGKGDLDSILGIVGRTASVAIEANERQERKLADVVIMPDTTGFSANDFLKTPELAKRGYAAAEAHRAELLKYALSDADWQAYLAHRASLRRGPAAPVLRVRVSAPTESARIEAEKLFAPLVNQPVDTNRIEALLDQLRADGAYDADYTVGYESTPQFQGQLAGTAPLPKGTVKVPVKTQQPAGGGGATAQPAAAKAGAPNPDAGATAATAPGDRPDASGMAATLPVTTASLEDIPDRPTILVTVTPKKTGPPFLLLGANLEAQGGGITRATVEGILVDQDFGSYGSELRSHIVLGYRTHLDTEYFHPLNFLAAADRNDARTFFIAPHAGLLREPLPIFPVSGNDQTRVADRQLQMVTAGIDVGGTNQRTQELRAGLDFLHVDWTTTIGSDAEPNLAGNAARAHLTFTRDTQDRALVPQFGVRLKADANFLFNASSLAAPGEPSPNAPSLTGQFTVAHRFSARAPLATVEPTSQGAHELLVFDAQCGTFFNRNVAQPFRFTLGGPLRLSASTIDQYRGTDYVLFEPALLRRIASLPAPLGQSIYLGLGYEYGQILAPFTPIIRRQDAYFGVVAETPLGVVTLAPAIGTNGERKFTFTLGRLF
jgi:NTE family protein